MDNGQEDIPSLGKDSHHCQARACILAHWASLVVTHRDERDDSLTVCRQRIGPMKRSASLVRLGLQVPPPKDSHTFRLARAGSRPAPPARALVHINSNLC
jgi:hypothetical protein